MSHGHELLTKKSLDPVMLQELALSPPGLTVVNTRGGTINSILPDYYGKIVLQLFTTVKCFYFYQSVMFTLETCRLQWSVWILTINTLHITISISLLTSDHWLSVTDECPLCFIKHSLKLQMTEKLDWLVWAAETWANREITTVIVTRSYDS